MAPRPLADKDWPRIRYEYEHTDKQTHEICADHRISITTLNNRARQWGWARRRQTVPAEGPPLPIALAQAPPPATPHEAAAFAEPSPHLAVPPAFRPGRQRAADCAPPAKRDRARARRDRCRARGTLGGLLAARPRPRRPRRRGAHAHPAGAECHADPISETGAGRE